MKFKQRVEEQEFRLNDTDDSVIEFIEMNRLEIQNISIHRIAEVLFVSPNAIMRTAKKLGYSGFSELKFSLQKEDNPSDTRTVEYQVLEKLPQNIVKSIDVIDDVKTEKLITDMLNSDKILFGGIGDSVYFCELFGRYLRCLDKRVEYYQQIHDIEYSLRQYHKGDLVLIISASGTPQRLLSIAKKAKEQGALVYCITNFGKNPLAEICDEQLCFWGEERIVNGYNVTDRSGLMMLIRLLCEAFWKRFCV